MDSRLGLFLGLLLAALALPSAAQAAVRCVPVSGPGCSSSHATISAAVGAASDDDTIQIAAGTFGESISTTKRLNFVGAGSGATIVAPASGSALTLSRGGSVRSLRAVGATASFSGSTALIMQPDLDGSFAYAVTDVIGIGGDGTDPFFGTGGAGLSVSSSSAARIVNLSLSGGSFRAGSSTSLFQGTALGLNGRGLTATLTSTTAIGPAASGGVGLAVAGGATADATGLSAQGYYAAHLGDATITLRRSVLQGVEYGASVHDFLSATPTTVNLIDDLITATPTTPVNAAALSASASSGGSPVAVNVRGSTIVARGVDPQYAVVARPGAGAPTATIDLRNTIAQLEGGAESDEADVAADRGTVTASHSDLAKTLQLNGGSVTGLTGTILSALPLFSSGAFTLQSSSPLLDRGDPAVVTSGERDLAGRPRAVDYDGDGVAEPDIGAYELPAPPTLEPPPPANTRPSLGKVSMTNKVFAPAAARPSAAAADRNRPRDRNRARARVKRGTRFRYLLSESATVTISIERRARGRRARGGRRCTRPTHRNGKRHACTRWLRAGVLKAREQAGSQGTPFSGRLKGRALKAGRYRARVVARDRAGARSRESRVAFEIVRAR